MSNASASGRALVTGASSGIGLELARVFAANGHPLILVARTEPTLQSLAAEIRQTHKVEVEVVPADLSDPAAPQRLFDAVRERGLDVDILVNNAGVMEVGAFHAMDAGAVANIAQVNVMALTALTSLFLKPMVSRGQGRILNVASLASFQPLPSMAVYAASKAYVLSLTEALAEEMRGQGVTVTALCPGFTETKLVEAAKQENAVMRAMPAALMADPRDVAQEGYRACMEGQVVRVPGTALSLATGLIQAQRNVVRTVTGLFGRRAM